MTILEELKRERIFSINTKDDRVYKIEEGYFRVEECCDNYNWIDLTKEELLQLAEEIKDLANAKHNQ